MDLYQEFFTPAALKAMEMEEQGYRRGACQGLALAARLVRAGVRADGLDELTNLSLCWRYDDESHPAYLDELTQTWRAEKRNRTGGAGG